MENHLRSKSFYLYVLILSAFLISGCATEKDFDWNKYKKDYPEAYEPYYQEMEKLPLEKRAIELNSTLKVRVNVGLEYLNPNMKVEPAEDLRKKNDIIVKELEKIPSSLKKVIEKRVLGWTVVKGIEASGAMIPLFGEDNYYRKGIIIINERALTQSLNDLTNIRESTVYEKGQYQIGLRTNKKISALLYIFLHESGHALDLKNSLVVAYDDGEYLENYINRAPFTKSSWKKDPVENKIVSKNKEMTYWPLMRKHYVVNQEKKQENLLLYAHFKDYVNSEFVTMYSAGNPSEDWADTFTQVVLEKYFKTKIEYFITQDKKEVLKYTPCSNRICLYKKQLVELFLEYPEMYLEEE